MEEWTQTFQTHATPPTLTQTTPTDLSSLTLSPAPVFHTITLHSLSSLPPLPPPLAARFVPPLQGTFSFRASLFDGLNSRFLGETYVSPPLSLPNPGSAVALALPCGLLTQVADPRLFLVVEFCLSVFHADKDDPSRTTTSEFGIGWALLPFLASAGPSSKPGIPRTATILPGTPRALASLPLIQIQKASGVASLSWTTSASSPDTGEDVAPFLPPHAVVGPGSGVPGLDMGPLATSLGVPSQRETYSLGVEAPSVTLPETFEEMLIARIRAHYAIAHDVDPDKLGAFSIVERRLKLGIHNTLKYIGATDQVTLHREPHSNSLVFDGSVNFPVVPSDDPNVALVVILEYVVARPQLPLTKKQRKSSVLDPPPQNHTYALSWHAHVLSSHGNAGELAAELVSGPSHNPDSTLLYTCAPTSSSVPFTPLVFQATLTPGGPESTSISRYDRIPAGSMAKPPRPDRMSSKGKRRTRKKRRKSSKKPQSGGGANENSMYGMPFAPSPHSGQASPALPPRGDTGSGHNGSFAVRSGAPGPATYGLSQHARASSGFRSSMSRADRAALFRAEYGEITDRFGEPPVDVTALVHAQSQRGGDGRSYGASVRDSLTLAKTDPLTVSTLHIQFLAYSKDAYADHPGPGKSFVFGFQFYSFPEMKTEPLLRELAPGARADAPGVLRRMNEAGDPVGSHGLSLQFTVDPAFMRPFEPQALAEYLASKALELQVWDGDSGHPVGSVRVPLRALLRAGNEAVAFTERFPVSAPESGVVGGLVLRMANVGTLGASQPAPYYPFLAPPPGSSTGSGPSRTGRVETARPLRELDQELDTLLKSRAAKSATSLDSRLDAVDKALAVAMGRTMLEARSGAPEDLKSVGLFRDRRRRLTLLSKVSASLTSKFSVYPAIGQGAFFEYELANPYDEPQVFAIEFDDLDLRVVTDYDEWMHCKRVCGVDTPAERRYMEEAGGVVSIHLDPRERVFIPFVFQCWDECEKDVRVQFSDARGRPAAILELTAAVSSPILDRTLWLRTPQNEYMKHRVPLGSSLASPYVRCSNPDVVCSMSGDGSELVFKVPVGSAGSLLSFVLIVYADPFMVSVEETVKVHVVSVHREDVFASVGQVADKALVVRGSQVPRKVRVFSSAPSVVYPSSSDVNLVANALNEVGLVFEPVAPGPSHVYLNLVDIETGDLVSTWLVVASGGAPATSKTFSVSLVPSGISRKNMEYKNPSRRTKAFTLKSSHPSILRLVSENIVVGPGDSSVISLEFFASGVGEGGDVVPVLLFINDRDSGVNVECIGFDVRVE